MIWRVGTQFLVGDGTSYQLVDATGAVGHPWADYVWDAQEDFGRVTYVIRDRKLVEHSEVESNLVLSHESDRVLLEGLEEDSSDEAARFVAIALGDHAVVLEEERLRDHREGEHRVAAVEGAREPMRDPWADKARQALVERIHRWGDDRSADLLRTLVDLVRAETSPEAVRAFASGSLRACFREAPEVEDAPAMASPYATRVAELAELVQLDGDGQADIDANMNARALWQAASDLRACARLLGG